MGKRDALIAKYANDLRTVFGIEPEHRLLERVTINCGPTIYDPASESVSPTSSRDRAHLRENFLVRKLGLVDGPQLTEAIDATLDAYGSPERPKYRAVVHYMLVLRFEKERRFTAR